MSRIYSRDTPNRSKAWKPAFFSLLFDFNSNFREPHNLWLNSPSPLGCPMPYMLYRCEYKSHPIFSHLESLLPNHFSQEDKRTHFLQGGERIWQQTTQASHCSSFGGLSEAVTGQQQNSHIAQSLLLANSPNFFTKCREFFIDWNPIHCFLTFVPFFSIYFTHGDTSQPSAQLFLWSVHQKICIKSAAHF